MRAKSGFTLVEILIVVVILGILAAIVIPQFTEASTEAKTSSLVSDLQTVRAQIQMYKIQHLDQLPTAGGLDFVTAMTTYTQQDGTSAASQAPADGVYGPYLNKMPSNQFVTTAANQALVLPQATTPAAPTGATGWFFNTTTGDFRANDTTDPNHFNL